VVATGESSLAAPSAGLARAVRDRRAAANDIYLVRSPYDRMIDWNYQLCNLETFHGLG
jgi:hypothetical protein